MFLKVECYNELLLSVAFPHISYIIRPILIYTVSCLEDSLNQLMGFNSDTYIIPEDGKRYTLRNIVLEKT
jgi:hypothetical protein